MRQLAESLRAFASVFSNPRLRSLQLAGIGSTFGTWAYGVALAVYAYDAGGAKAVGVLYGVRWGSPQPSLRGSRCSPTVSRAGR
jgi:hypothetical protein